MHYTQLLNCLGRFTDLASQELCVNPYYSSDSEHNSLLLYEYTTLENLFETVSKQKRELVFLQDANNAPGPVINIYQNARLQEIIESLANQTLINRRICEIPFLAIDEDSGSPIVVKAFNEALSVLTACLRPNGIDLELGQARCPVTPNILSRSNMKPATSFKNLFFIAVRNAMLYNPEEFSGRDKKDTVEEFCAAFENINLTQIIQAEADLQSLLLGQTPVGTTSTQVEWLRREANLRPSNAAIHTQIRYRETNGKAIKTALALAASKSSTIEPLKNSEMVLQIAQKIQRKEIEITQQQKYLQQARANNPETSIEIALQNKASIFFEKIVKPRYDDKFWSHCARPNVKNETNKLLCIEAIIEKIKDFLLNYLIQDTDTPAHIKAWIRASKAILLNSMHQRHYVVTQESHHILNSVSQEAQIAWRNFDEYAPSNNEWPNLLTTPQFTDSNYVVYDMVEGQRPTKYAAKNQCRLTLAYYFLALMDDTLTVEQKNVVSTSFVGQLADIRRAHNKLDGVDDGRLDNPSCFPGTLTRIAKMGDFHPFIELPPEPEEIARKMVSFFFCRAIH